MSQEKPIFDYHEESQTEKLARKSKESPFMVIGMFIHYHCTRDYCRIHNDYICFISLVDSIKLKNKQVHI